MFVEVGRRYYQCDKRTCNNDKPKNWRTLGEEVDPAAKGLPKDKASPCRDQQTTYSPVLGLKPCQYQTENRGYRKRNPVRERLNLKPITDEIKGSISGADHGKDRRSECHVFNEETASHAYYNTCKEKRSGEDIFEFFHEEPVSIC